MKKNMKILAVIAVLAISLVVTNAVFAQGGPGGNGNGKAGNGTGVVSLNLDVTLSNYMPIAIAETLGMSVDEVNSLLASGETFYTIALSKGYTADQIAVLMDAVRAKAIDLALADGVITVEQAEWLLTNQGGMNQNNYSSSGFTAQPQTGTGLCDGTCDGTVIPAGSAHRGMARQR